VRVIHLARKPLSESSVATNVLEHETGAINIGASRIGTSKEVPGSPSRRSGAVYNCAEDGSFRRETGAEGGHNPNVGRWPANMVLEHRPACRRVGTRKVKGIVGTAAGKMAGSPEGVAYGRVTKDGDSRWKGSARAGEPCGYADKDGTETVEAWACEPGCSVAELDDQSLSGGMHGAGHAQHQIVSGDVAASSYNMGGVRSVFRLGDAGGASRFYKQVGGSSSEGDEVGR